ncbi:MAG: twin-arginine translocation pathway signal protein [Elusimicrobia bacterium GWF2_62_30]|nr:MAG: twin-arginine translocation pathway signal protein [Elusimicrobia bacterium GWF2_62_30]
MRHLLLVALLVSCSFASVPQQAPREGRLRLFNTHTLERLDVVYSRDGVYDPQALEKLDHFLRDWRTDRVKHHDPRLFDLLDELASRVDRPGTELQVICGYRTPESNRRLRTRGSGVAGNSLHMQAKAIDIRVPGVRTSRLRDTALALRGGGVGYYPGSDFIHVDLGRVRRW